MKRIPSDLDRLMWTVAEQRDAKAIEEFGERFPELRTELLKRVGMVNGLRGTMRSTNARREIPEFKPRSSAQKPAFRPLVFAATISVLAALGFATYSVTSYLTRPPVTVAREAEQPTTEVEAPPRRLDPIEPDIPDRILTPPPQRQETPLPTYMRPKTIRIDRAPLHTVIAMVGLECGLEVEIAPGLENPDINATYENVAGLEMLKDLGKRFGFTVFAQGANKVLVIPAVDGATAGPATGGAF